MKIYIDCTHTYTADILTGIQRVVINVVEQAVRLSTQEVTVIPVILKGNKFYRVDIIPGYTFARKINAGKQKFTINKKNFAFLIRNLLFRIHNSKIISTIKSVLKHCCPSVFNALKRIYYKTKSELQQLFTSTNASECLVRFEKGNVLFLLDSVWDITIWDDLEKAKLAGVKIIFSTYDLIPITHPEFCDVNLVRVFNGFYQQALGVADGFVSISKTVRDETMQYALQQHPDTAKKMYFDYFYLGADFAKLSSGEAVVGEHIRHFFQTKRPVYLIVSTIEPRKNHAYLLDAFEQLWRNNDEVALCIVGKVGWHVEQLMQRLDNHPQKNIRLMVWNDINDDELSYCYQYAKCLVFPSIVEGFGLPIVEAFKHQLPVIASDTKIHREIGGDLAMYVDINNVQSLVGRIEEIEQNGVSEAHQPSESYKWLSWEDATRMLLNKLSHNLGNQANELKIRKPIRESHE